MKNAGLMGMAGLVVFGLSGCAWLGGLMAPDKQVKVEEVGRAQRCNGTTERASLQILPSASDAVIWQRRNNLDLTGNVTLPAGKYIVVEMGIRERDGYGFVVSPQAQLEREEVRLHATLITPDADAQATMQTISPCVMLRLPEGSWTEAVLYDQNGKRLARSLPY